MDYEQKISEDCWSRLPIGYWLNIEKVGKHGLAASSQKNVSAQRSITAILTRLRIFLRQGIAV